jgi:VanZ family protein
MLNWSTARKQWYRRALPAYWIFLFCATHFPRPELPGVPASDKLAHLGAFAALAFLFWRCVESFHRKLSGRFVWIAFAGLAAYAAVDEYLQRFVNRGPSLDDWFADLAGIAAVLAILERRRRLTASPHATRPSRPRP